MRVKREKLIRKYKELLAIWGGKSCKLILFNKKIILTQ